MEKKELRMSNILFWLYAKIQRLKEIPWGLSITRCLKFIHHSNFSQYYRAGCSNNKANDIKFWGLNEIKIC